MSGKNRSTIFPYVTNASGNLIRVFWIAGKAAYCQEMKVDSRHVYQPLDPQPDSAAVIKVRRYYVTLAANQHYRRRITLLVDSSSASATAIVEYFGEHVTSAPHGGNENPADKAPYVRTPAATLAQVGEVTQKMPVQAAYNHLLQQMDMDDAPCDSKVVRNKKRQDAKDRRDEAGTHHCANFANEVLAVINMVHSDTFVRSVEATQKRMPSVILYDDRQISDIKGLCFGGKEGSVLAYDKTYIQPRLCLRDKNSALCHPQNNESKLFLGPIFVHGHSDFDTYTYFSPRALLHAISNS